MSDELKKAVADVVKTIREIRTSTGPAQVRVEEGDFFTFSTPGRMVANEPSVKGRVTAGRTPTV